MSWVPTLLLSEFEISTSYVRIFHLTPGALWARFHFLPELRGIPFFFFRFYHIGQGNLTSVFAEFGKEKKIFSHQVDRGQVVAGVMTCRRTETRVWIATGVLFPLLCTGDRRFGYIGTFPKLCGSVLCQSHLNLVPQPVPAWVSNEFPSFSFWFLPFPFHFLRPKETRFLEKWRKFLFFQGIPVISFLWEQRKGKEKKGKED